MWWQRCWYLVVISIDRFFSIKKKKRASHHSSDSRARIHQLVWIQYQSCGLLTPRWSRTSWLCALAAIASLEINVIVNKILSKFKVDQTYFFFIF